MSWAAPGRDILTEHLPGPARGTCPRPGDRKWRERRRRLRHHRRNLPRPLSGRRRPDHPRQPRLGPARDRELYRDRSATGPRPATTRRERRGAQVRCCTRATVARSSSSRFSRSSSWTPLVSPSPASRRHCRNTGLGSRWMPSCSTSMARRLPRSKRSPTSQTAESRWRRVPIPTCPPPTTVSCPRGRPTSRTSACAAVTNRLSDLPSTRRSPRFTRKRPGPRATPADGEATLCAVLVETDDDTGLARHVGVLRRGGALECAWPV